MIRRLLLVSGLWLGLLGIMQPLLACAVNSSMLNCCPGGVQLPCDLGADQTDPGSSSTRCCGTVPSTTSAVIAVDSKDTPLAPATGGYPAHDTHLAAISWPVPIVDNRNPPSHIPVLPASSGGADTYLRTGRLRL